MKKMIIVFLALSTLSAFAAEISGEASLRYTPGLSSRGDIFVRDEMADAIYDQMLAIPVIKGDDFDAKYGDGVACFKYKHSNHVCRLTVKFTNQ